MLRRRGNSGIFLRKAEQKLLAGPREHPPHEVTQLLQAWSAGEADALEKLMPLIYQELYRLARRHMARERPSHTLSPTALVNEAYLRLVDSTGINWQSRAHFLSVCAQVMRRILVDWVRSRHARKRGGDLLFTNIDDALAVAGGAGSDLVAVDDALKALAVLDPRKSQVVELRFFGGLSARETAEVLKVSPKTVLRDWKLSRSWLRRELLKENPGEA